MNLKGKKILITGGAGFIGSNLNKKLTALGAKTEIFDTAFKNNICDKNQLKKYVAKKFDVIYHLAAFSGNKESNKDKLKCFQINTIATIDLLDLIVTLSPKTKVILSNSRLEYGKPKYLPVDENHPTEPLSAYGLSKLTTTQMAQIYKETKKLKFTVIRSSNVYGPHTDTSFKGYNLINYFIDQAKKGGSLTIFGKGDQLRDYIYIDDLTDAFTSALASKANGQVYNLGYAKGIALREMATLIIKIVGNGGLKFLDWPKDYNFVETGSYITDISKIKRDLDFNPTVDFKEGIKKTLEIRN